MLKESKIVGEVFGRRKHLYSIYKKMKERGKTKLILDLRDNGGGNMKVLTYIASYFINNNGKSNAVVAISKGKQQNQTVPPRC